MRMQRDKCKIDVRITRVGTRWKLHGHEHRVTISVSCAASQQPWIDFKEGETPECASERNFELAGLEGHAGVARGKRTEIEERGRDRKGRLRVGGGSTEREIEREHDPGGIEEYEREREKKTKSECGPGRWRVFVSRHSSSWPRFLFSSHNRADRIRWSSCVPACQYRSVLRQLRFHVLPKTSFRASCLSARSSANVTSCRTAKTLTTSWRHSVRNRICDLWHRF